MTSDVSSSRSRNNSAQSHPLQLQSLIESLNRHVILHHKANRNTDDDDSSSIPFHHQIGEEEDIQKLIHKLKQSIQIGPFADDELYTDITQAFVRCQIRNRKRQFRAEEEDEDETTVTTEYDRYEHSHTRRNSKSKNTPSHSDHKNVNVHSRTKRRQKKENVHDYVIRNCYSDDSDLSLDGETTVHTSTRMEMGNNNDDDDDGTTRTDDNHAVGGDRYAKVNLDGLDLDDINSPKEQDDDSTYFSASPNVHHHADRYSEQPSATGEYVGESNSSARNTYDTSNPDRMIYNEETGDVEVEKKPSLEKNNVRSKEEAWEVDTDTEFQDEDDEDMVSKREKDEQMAQEMEDLHIGSSTSSLSRSSHSASTSKKKEKEASLNPLGGSLGVPFNLFKKFERMGRGALYSTSDAKDPKEKDEIHDHSAEEEKKETFYPRDNVSTPNKSNTTTTTPTRMSEEQARQQVKNAMDAASSCSNSVASSTHPPKENRTPGRNATNGSSTKKMDTSPFADASNKAQPTSSSHSTNRVNTNGLPEHMFKMPPLPKEDEVDDSDLFSPLESSRKMKNKMMNRETPSKAKSMNAATNPATANIPPPPPPPPPPPQSPSGRTDAATAASSQSFEFENPIFKIGSAEKKKVGISPSMSPTRRKKNITKNSASNINANIKNMTMNTDLNFNQSGFVPPQLDPQQETAPPVTQQPMHGFATSRNGTHGQETTTQQTSSSNPASMENKDSEVPMDYQNLQFNVDLKSGKQAPSRLGRKTSVRTTGVDATTTSKSNVNKTAPRMYVPPTKLAVNTSNTATPGKPTNDMFTPKGFGTTAQEPKTGDAMDIDTPSPRVPAQNQQQPQQQPQQTAPPVATATTAGLGGFTIGSSSAGKATNSFLKAKQMKKQQRSTSQPPTPGGSSRFGNASGTSTATTTAGGNFGNFPNTSSFDVKPSMSMNSDNLQSMPSTYSLPSFDDSKSVSSSMDDVTKAKHQQILMLREKARSEYKDQDYQSCVRTYTNAIAIHTNDFTKFPNVQTKVKESEVLASLYGNRAAALMMIGAFNAGAADCTKALKYLKEYNPLASGDNEMVSNLKVDGGLTLRAKLLARKGRAKIKLGNYTEAQRIFDEAIRVAQTSLGLHKKIQVTLNDSIADKTKDLLRGSEKVLNQCLTDAALTQMEIKRLRELHDSINSSGGLRKEVDKPIARRKHQQVFPRVNTFLTIAPASTEMQTGKVYCLASMKKWTELASFCEELASKHTEMDGVFIEDLKEFNPFPNVQNAVHLNSKVFENKTNETVLNTKQVGEAILRIPYDIQPLYLRALRLNERYVEGHKAIGVLDAYSEGRGPMWSPIKQREKGGYDWLPDERDKLRRTMSGKDKGDSLYKSGEYHRAAEKYGTILRIDSNSTDQSVDPWDMDTAGGRLHAVLHCNRAACLMAVKKFQEASKECTAALKIEHFYMKAMLRRARCYARLERFEECLTEYKRWTGLVEEAKLGPSHQTGECLFDKASDVGRQDSERVTSEISEIKKMKHMADLKARKEAQERAQAAAEEKSAAFRNRQHWYEQKGSAGSRRWDTFQGRTPPKNSNNNSKRGQAKGDPFKSDPFKDPFQSRSQRQNHFKSQQQKQQKQQKQAEKSPSSNSVTCHYSVLQVPKKASSGEIKKAYHKLALKYHPDKNPSDSAAEVFRKVKLAYETLSNDKARRQYDLERVRQFSF